MLHFLHWWFNRTMQKYQINFFSELQLNIFCIFSLFQPSQGWLQLTPGFCEISNRQGQTIVLTQILATNPLVNSIHLSFLQYSSTEQVGQELAASGRTHSLQMQWSCHQQQEEPVAKVIKFNYFCTKLQAGQMPITWKKSKEQNCTTKCWPLRDKESENEERKNKSRRDIVWIKKNLLDTGWKHQATSHRITV